MSGLPLSMINRSPHTQSHLNGNALYHSQSTNSLNDQDDQFYEDCHDSNSSRYLNSNLNLDRERQYLLLRQEQQQQQQQLQLQQQQQHQQQQQQLQMRRLQLQGQPHSPSISSTPFPYYQNQNNNQNNNSNDNNNEINIKVHDNEFHQIGFPTHSQNIPKNVFGSPQRDSVIIPQRDREIIPQRDREIILQREREIILKPPATFLSQLASNNDNFKDNDNINMNFHYNANSTNIDDEENKNNYNKIYSTKSTTLDISNGRNGFDLNQRNNRINDQHMNLTGHHEIGENVNERIASQMINFPSRIASERGIDSGSRMRNQNDDQFKQQQPFIFKTSSDSNSIGGIVDRFDSTDFGFLETESTSKSKSELLFKSVFGLGSESVSFFSSGLGSGFTSEHSALLEYDSRNRFESLSPNNDDSKYGLLGLLNVLRLSDKVSYCILFHYSEFLSNSPF